MHKKYFYNFMLLLALSLFSCQTMNSANATTMVAILKTELASLNLENPEVDLERNYLHGDKRCIGIYGFTLLCPGLEDISYDLIKKYGVRPIEGTSDSIESGEHGRLIGLATKYAKTYNQALVRKITGAQSK